MKYWLLKTEPETFSWQMQKARGAKGEPWSGVRNHQAKLNLMAMKKGDRAFFYHSGKTREIVGILEVIGGYRADPTDASGKFGLVDVKAVAEFEKPVTLDQAKADPKLKDMVLVNFTRLSVQPVDAAAWKHIVKLGKAKAV